MPFASKVGVSRKIENREQRAKLREMVSNSSPRTGAGGWIIRTVAEDLTEQELQARSRSPVRPVDEDQAQIGLSPGARAACNGRRRSPAASSATSSRTSRSLLVDSKVLHSEWCST